MAGEEVSGDKRRTILDAAVRVFSRYGFDRAKIEDIAVEAGIGKGTVYEYFRSKEELFREMLADSTDRYIEGAREVIESSRGQSTWERIARDIRLHLKFMDQHRDMARILIGNHPPIGDKEGPWMERRQKRVEMVAAMLQEGIDRGEMRTVDTTIMAHVIIGLEMILGMQMVFRQKELDIDQVSAEAVDIMRHGLEKGKD